MADSDPPAANPAAHDPAASAAPSQPPTATTTTTTTTTTPAPANASAEKGAQTEAGEASSIPTAAEKEAGPAPKASSDGDDDDVNPPDFQGSVLSNDDLPSPETIRRIGEYAVLDRYGKTHTFKSLYTGRNVARRVLIIFVRHFYCGNCQEYLRTLSASIQADSLLHLPVSTFIAVIGCGDPALIDMYAEATGCPYPIYADPTRRLYQELGMIKTLALGQRPAYISKSLFKSSLESIVQGVKQIRSGLAIRGGDQRQIGGEFLFEPLDLQSPDAPSPVQEFDRRLRLDDDDGDDNNNNNSSSSERKAGGGNTSTGKEGEGDGVGSGGKPSLDATAAAGSNKHSRTTSVTDNDNDEIEAPHLVEDKKVTWCHRMRTTRDHAEIPELMEVLGLNGQGRPIKDQKRWSRALEQRKGTGLSMASRMSQLGAPQGQQQQ